MAPLLVAILDEQRTGTLVIEESTGAKSAIYFQSGAPAKAKTAEAVAHLGTVLLEMGVVDDATRDASLRRVARERRLHGQVLLADGALDEQALVGALREQILRRVAWLFGRPPDAMAGFYDGTNFLERWGKDELTPVSPLAAIWRGVRDFADLQTLRPVVDALGDAPLLLRGSAQLSAFELGAPEDEIAKRLVAGPMPVSALVAADLGKADTIHRLVYTLAVTRQLQVVTPAPAGVSERPGSNRVSAVLPAGAASSRTSQPGCGSSAADSRIGPMRPEHAQLRAELTELSASLAQLSMYELLGVPETAPAAAIGKAFLELAKKWHPDRLPKELSDLRLLTDQVFTRITEAHQTLSDADRRAEYDQGLLQRAGEDEQQKVMHVLRAATAFQKAEVLLKKRAYADAETEARQAVSLDPEQADYMALLAWIQAQRQTSPQDLERLIATLDSAVRRDENNERIRYYRAQLLKRAGLEDRAFADYRWIAEHNPRHVDAVREIRLHSMRHRRASTRPSSPRVSAPPTTRRNLIDKLFKR